MTSVNVMPGRPSSPIVSLPTFWKETQKVILPIREPKLYVSGKISLCVECLEKYLLHGNSDVEAFDIPELEVRPGMMEPMTVSDPLPPQLCECDELGSICGLCKIVMDKIVSSTPHHLPLLVLLRGLKMKPCLRVCSTPVILLFHHIISCGP